MKRSAMFFACAALMLCSAVQAEAGFYRWVDRDGREFFTNDQEKIPAEYRDSAKPVEVSDDRVSVDKSSPAGVSQRIAASEHKDKNGRGEEYWHKRAENLRRQIREKQDDLDLLVKQERNENRKSRKNSSRAKKKTALENKIARLNHELEVELPEEARKADAYPGWLRE